ncbi:MAG: TlpA family protein disulfide reductase [Pyrinomonadaceae bacterium]|nr:TlpA family protein disulfide reductase [Pyrinomonadaceae bacterium]
MKYSGKLETELKPELKWLFSFKVEEVKIINKTSLPKRVQNASKFFIGQIIDPRESNKKLPFLFLETPSEYFICIDPDKNNVVNDNECFDLKNSSLNTKVWETSLQLPISFGKFKQLPVYISLEKSNENGKLTFKQSLYNNALGNVSINNREVLFLYGFNPFSGKVLSTSNGMFGVDIDGDGKISREAFSLESCYADNFEPIFHLDDIFISTSNIDLQTGEIVLKNRLKNEYERTEVIIGKELPDFSFVDLEGKKRNLSEFRGKFVMIDFWGAWCVDCRREIPNQIEAYKKFRQRGFEILGMDTDENLQTLRDYVQKNGMEWTQARFDSIKHIVEKNYLIDDYPTSLIIGPDGKVLVIDQKQFKEAELHKLLDQILPKE